MNMNADQAKEAAGKKALEFVKDGMVLGLGTGTTSAHFIRLLIEAKKSGLSIQTVATSVASEKMAREGGIPVLDINSVTELDLTVDGADEIDPQMRLIKGAGGAFVREKIIANMSKEMIVIADPSKLVDSLGKRHLPVEILPFGAEATKKQIESLGMRAQWRLDSSNQKTITDNNNWVLDIKLSPPLSDPKEIHLRLVQIPGVIETGFFLNLASRIIIGHPDGSASVKP